MTLRDFLLMTGAAMFAVAFRDWREAQRTKRLEVQMEEQNDQFAGVNQKLDKLQSDVTGYITNAQDTQKENLDLRAEVDTLKNQHPTVDFSAVEARIDAIDALVAPVAATPIPDTPTPAESVSTPEPVEVTPIDAAPIESTPTEGDTPTAPISAEDDGPSSF